MAALTARVPDVLETPLVTPAPDWTYRAVPLLETAGQPPPVYVLRLRLEDPVPLLSSPEVRMPFTTYDGRLDLIDASLAVLGTPCIYRTPARARLAPNRELSFFRGNGCYSLRSPPTGELVLTVQLARRARVALWTYQPISDVSIPGALRVLAIPRSAAPAPLVAGRFVTPLPDTHSRRVDLLSYMWQIAPGPLWIYFAVGIACALLSIGFTVAPRCGALRSEAQWPTAATAAINASCVAAALGILYAVLVPPFQAADEPTHFMSFAATVGRSELDQEARQWGALGHFARLQFRPDEVFRPADVGHPQFVNRDFEQTDIERRSGTLQYGWRLVARRLGGYSAPATFLALRLINVLIFATAMGVAMFGLVLLTDAPLRHVWLLITFSLPTLPFFAMLVSNYAPETSLYVLLAAGVCILFLDGVRAHYAGAFLGLSLALAVATSRSALPMTALVAMLLAGRLLLGTKGVATTTSAVRRATIFWGLFACGLLAFSSFVTNQQVDFAVATADRRFSDAWRVWPTRLGGWWSASEGPWRLIVGIGCVAAGVGAEVSCFVLRRRLGAGLMRMAMPLARWTVAAIAGAVGLSLVLSLFLTFPQMPGMVLGEPPAMGEYVRQALWSSITTFRAANHDYLLATTFWGGFGWLETILPEPFVSGLVIATGVALIFSAALIASRREARRCLWLVLVLAGLAASVAAYAAAAVVVSRPPVATMTPLHGRYLIGVYLLLVLISWSWLAMPLTNSDRSDGRHVEVRSRILVGAACLVHAYALSFILDRYL